MRRLRRADRPFGNEEVVLSRQRNETGVTVHNLRRQRQRVDDQASRFPEGTQQPGPPQLREIVSAGVACIHPDHVATLVPPCRIVLADGKRSATRIHGHGEALAGVRGSSHPMLSRSSDEPIRRAPVRCARDALVPSSGIAGVSSAGGGFDSLRESRRCASSEARSAYPSCRPDAVVQKEVPGCRREVPEKLTPPQGCRDHRS